MNTNQTKALRSIFKLLNRLMVLMWKLGMGRMINFWPAGIGRIMVIKHTGRKSGKVRFAPVNYAPIAGEIYCTAGFGAESDWYRNIMANRTVELWLPNGKFAATVEDISNSPERLFLLRNVLIASGFAAPLFGVNPNIPEDQLAVLSAEYRLLHFILEK